MKKLVFMFAFLTPLVVVASDRRASDVIENRMNELGRGGIFSEEANNTIRGFCRRTQAFLRDRGLGDIPLPLDVFEDFNPLAIDRFMSIGCTYDNIVLVSWATWWASRIVEEEWGVLDVGREVLAGDEERINAAREFMIRNHGVETTRRFRENNLTVVSTSVECAVSHIVDFFRCVIVQDLSDGTFYRMECSFQGVQGSGINCRGGFGRRN